MLLVHAAQDLVGGELLSERYCPCRDTWKEKPLTAEIDEVARGSFKRKEPPESRAWGTWCARSKRHFGPLSRASRPRRDVSWQ